MQRTQMTISPVINGTFGYLATSFHILFGLFLWPLPVLLATFLSLHRLLSTKKLQVISNIFVVNLAIADIVVTAIIIPFAALGLFNDADKLFGIYSELCIVLGAVVVISCACSIWSIAALSVERYYHINHSEIYPILFNRRSTPFILLSIWCIALAIALPYFKYFGWGGYKYVFYTCTCSWSYTHYSQACYSIVLGLLVPMIIIPYCYIRICFFVRESKQRMSRHESKSGVNKNASMGCFHDHVGSVYFYCLV